jgi:hypothetical protein
MQQDGCIRKAIRRESVRSARSCRSIPRERYASGGGAGLNRPIDAPLVEIPHRIAREGFREIRVAERPDELGRASREGDARHASRADVAPEFPESTQDDGSRKKQRWLGER